MNPLVIIAIITAAKEFTLALMELQGKDTLTKADLMAKTPEELLAEMGIDLNEPFVQPPHPPPLDHP